MAFVLPGTEIGYSHSLDCSSVTYGSWNAAHMHFPHVMFSGRYTNVYTLCKVNNVDLLNRYYMLYM